MCRAFGARLAAASIVVLIAWASLGCTGQSPFGPSATPTPTVEARAAQIKEHLTKAVSHYGDEVFPGGNASSQKLSPLGNSYSQYIVKKYLEGIVRQARDDDMLAMYLLWMAPVLDVAPNVHVRLLEDRFLSRFSRSVAETGSAPLQVLALLTAWEREYYDNWISMNGARICSPYLYASLR